MRDEIIVVGLFFFCEKEDKSKESMLILEEL